MANFKRLKSGWRYRLKYTDPFTQQQKEKSERGFRTKPEAELAATEFLKKIKQGYEQIDMPLVDYIESWIINYKKGDVRKNTLKQHMNNLKTHIKPYFKQLMIKDLKPDMYQKFLDACLEKNLSRRTVEIINSTVYSALELAVIQGKLERNPCIGSIIKGERKQKTIDFIDSEDIPRFLYTARGYGYIYWIFFKLLLETGMRKGEAAALKWSDINFKEKKIHINETLDFQPDNEDELFGETKTFRSKRTISVSTSLINDLKYHASWQNQNKINLGETMYRHDLNLVLCRNDGRPMPKSTLFNAFKRILKRASLDEVLRIHSLRHTYAVLMLEAGADIKFVQEQLGHGSVQITSDVYAHISKKLEKRNIDRYEEYTSKILGSNNLKLGDVWGTPQKN
ncbi:Tyrosine recombinase XerC [Paenibacillus polymyxa]|uniref:site-specific integrase n=1 Tax=Paenibacillus polymyxa TaxID=1406 RepID=UPI0009476A58|nr:site-specific integrase [Paenibacillus polymyxa]APQ59870.1 integrase [Paenibacillus polymyxa]VUG06102.1 Tyrosine recombinase XerC [Paenibacillus polymyxa]